MKKLNKTTIEIYWSMQYLTYMGIYYYFYISFYGTNAEKLRKEWNKLLGTERNKEIEKFESMKKFEIIEKEKEIKNFKKTFWNGSKLKTLKEELKELNKKQFRGLGEWREYILALTFVSNKKAVKISTGDKSTIYEI